MYSRTAEKRRLVPDLHETTEHAGPALPNSHYLDSPRCTTGTSTERKVRREIANCNERRRMQSINAGFESLKTIIPHSGSEKLSKAAILQQTANYVSTLEEEKSCLLSQNSQLKKLLGQFTQDNYYKDSPPPKRKKRDTESSDEGISMTVSAEFDEDIMCEEIKKQVVELRVQLERERALRSILEERTRMLHGDVMYPDHLRIFADRVQQHFNSYKEKTITEPRMKIVSEEPDTIQPPLASPQMKYNHSMSQRNLETIVEAIRHLEGDYIMPKMEDNENDQRNCQESNNEIHDVHSRLVGDEIRDVSSRLVAEEIVIDHIQEHTTDHNLSKDVILIQDAVVPNSQTINTHQLSPVILHKSPRTVYSDFASKKLKSASFLTSDLVQEHYPASIQLLHQPVVSPHYYTSTISKC